MNSSTRKIGCRAIWALALAVLLKAASAQANNIGYVKLVEGKINGRALRPCELQSVVLPQETVVSGRITCVTFNLMPGNSVAPFGYTWTWQDRRTAVRAIDPWIGTGATAWTVDFSLPAPAEPGRYALVFAFGGEFDLSQVFSCHGWNAGSVVWFDGNDYADMGASEFAEAGENGYVSDWPYGDIQGFSRRDVPCLPIVIERLAGLVVIVK